MGELQQWKEMHSSSRDCTLRGKEELVGDEMAEDPVGRGGGEEEPSSVFNIRAIEEAVR